MRTRLLAGLLGTLMLLTPNVTAAAADDPTPPDWPEVQVPNSTGGSADDPTPVDWPGIIKPNTGTASDPKPKEWPAPQQA
ncbi:hypothetical protein [Kribbella sp. CA-294648]|uniref:hypothetical protein n=1 Tax=Kribbella sp. CA-294648 TaxID=3239948 RepID=UPI003D8BA4AB